jgi:WD40 repeat protein
LIIPVKDAFWTGIGSRSRWALLSPTSEHILTLEGSVLRLWSGQTGALTNEFDLHIVPLPELQWGGRRFIEFSPNGELIGAALNDGSLKLMDAQSGYVSLLACGVHPGRLAFSADGKRLGAAIDGKILLWDLPERERDPITEESLRHLATFDTRDLILLSHKIRDRVFSLADNRKM